MGDGRISRHNGGTGGRTVITPKLVPRLRYHRCSGAGLPAVGIQYGTGARAISVLVTTTPVPITPGGSDYGTAALSDNDTSHHRSPVPAPQRQLAARLGSRVSSAPAGAVLSPGSFDAVEGRLRSHQERHRQTRGWLRRSPSRRKSGGPPVFSRRVLPRVTTQTVHGRRGSWRLRSRGRGRARTAVNGKVG